MSKKQTTVSEAAANTKIVKRTKNVMKLDVGSVKLAGELRKVRFIAKNTKGGVVICRTKGQPPIRVRQLGAVFSAFIRGATDDEIPTAKTPDQAFARGVKAFWS